MLPACAALSNPSRGDSIRRTAADAFCPRHRFCPVIGATDLMTQISRSGFLSMPHFCSRHWGYGRIAAGQPKRFFVHATLFSHHWGDGPNDADQPQRFSSMPLLLSRPLGDGPDAHQPPKAADRGRPTGAVWFRFAYHGSHLSLLFRVCV